MKRIASWPIALLLSCLCVTAYGKGSLPPGTLKKGSLANKQLISDTLVGVFSKVASLGCTQIESFDPYVTAKLKGTKGSRVWRERWFVGCGGKSYPIDIRFSEAGMDAASYQIE